MWRSGGHFHCLWLADDGSEFFEKIAGELICGTVYQAAAKLSQPAADIGLCRIFKNCRIAVGG
jgi:hypothetical protein